MKNEFPLFYFKPTICWLDDDQMFLHAANMLFSKRYHCKFFHHTDEALRFFSHYRSLLSSCNFAQTIEDDPTTNMNLQSIQHLKNLPNRFSEVAVLISDYHMPGRHGLQICEELKHIPCKKILLTGAASHTEAVRGFNHGLINRFIEKGVNVAENLEKYITELVNQYFSLQTQTLLTHLEANRPSPFSDPIFIHFFRNWCQENQISEYYLIQPSGTFHLILDNGQTGYFILMSESDHTEFADTYYEIFNQQKELANDFKHGKRIPFFGLEKAPWEIEREEWHHYFYPAEILQGREKYYWVSLGW